MRSIPSSPAKSPSPVAKRKVASLVTIEERDIFTVDYRKNTVIVMYLLPEMIMRLLPKFEELQPGARIVAHDYPIGDVLPDKEVTYLSNEDNVEHTLFVYKLPLRRKT